MVKRKPVKRTRGFTRDKIDRDLLHQYLWQTKDRYGFMSMASSELADHLGLSIWHMSRILRELQDSGKVIKQGSKFKIVDPTITQWTS